MKERESGDPFCLAGKTPAEQIDLLLNSSKPFLVLAAIIEEIPERIPHQKLVGYWEKQDRVSLLFYSLRTFGSVLNKILGRGSRDAKQELFEQGICWLWRCVSCWKPEVNGHPYNLCCHVNNRLTDRLRTLRKGGLELISYDDRLPLEVPSPEPECVRGIEWKTIVDCLSLLPEREKTTLMLKFGFWDGREWTFQEIAEELGISDTRAWQIKNAALRRLFRMIRGSREPFENP